VCLQKDIVPGYEVILVDDHSSDRTLSIANGRMKVHSCLRVISLEENEAGKKAALSKGVSVSTNAIILVTDADCVVKEQWSRVMSTGFSSPHVNFVTGPVTYTPQGMLVLAEPELQGIQVVSFGLGSISGLPLASGANMGFRKVFFERIGGFTQDRFASGDDIFLLEKAKEQDLRSAVFVRDRNAIVSTRPVRGLAGMIGQRARWLSKTAGMGSLLMRSVGFIVALTDCWALFVGIRYLMGEHPDQWGGALLIAKISIDVLLLSLAFPFFRKAPVFIALVLMELLYPLIIILSALASLSGTVRWKERVIKGR
jgi:cellulose synthase/poly-beta-1,6-N-acetylglucosamine synthase-like glycosyltransferase